MTWKDLIKDLKEYVGEDDYPTPNPFQTFILIRKIFDVIQDALAKQHRCEKFDADYIETSSRQSSV